MSIKGTSSDKQTSSKSVQIHRKSDHSAYCRQTVYQVLYISHSNNHYNESGGRKALKIYFYELRQHQSEELVDGIAGPFFSVFKIEY